MRLSLSLVSACLVLASTSPSYATDRPGPAGPLAPPLTVADTSPHGQTVAGHRAAPGVSPAVARAALAEARSWAARDGASSRASRATGPDRDPTFVLRDLRLGLDALSPRDRAAAERLLARPSDGNADPAHQGYTAPERYQCSAHVCLHWVESTEDAVSRVDANGDGTPDWVATNLTVLEQVWDHVVVTSGYRAPLADTTSANAGPDGRLDVYLADVGDKGTYGYCTTDDPRWRQQFHVSAYCVLDNDFAARQFGGQDPLSSLEVTAAHEFFHAVQFGYDFLEDDWLMEGTATWMEDEVFDHVDDNHQYFATSALVLPELSTDYGDEGFQYGAWVFWRFLSEYYGTATAPDPRAVRSVWDLADAAPGGPDMHSLQAVSAFADASGTTFARLFADFGAVNRIADRWYFEGAAYPLAPVRRTHALSSSRKSSGWYRTRLDHLANTNVAFTPATSLRGTWRLRLELDLPPRSRGSAATVAVENPNGAIDLSTVKLDRQGDATVHVPFTRSQVARVALTLTNASTRMDCTYDQPFSCGGTSYDDGLAFSYTAKAIR